MDAVEEESDTANNCSSSVEINVPELEEEHGTPDLIILTVSVATSPGGTYPGGSFTFSTTVRNNGDGASAATTLRYYQSTDTTISASDTEVDTDAVAGLGAMGNTNESVDIIAPPDPGTYYYGACVDAVTDESETTNNCSSSVRVNVLESQNPPNLVVESPSVSDNTPETEAMFSLSATVRNNGNGDSEAAILRYYRSTDATITTSDTEVGTDAVGVLAASGTSTQSISLTASATEGVYYYGACVDAVTDESDTTDNCSTSVKVDVETPQPKYPNLQVGTPTADWTNPVTGETFTLSATVYNFSLGVSTATTLRYYRSADATVTLSDTEVGTDAVGTLSAYGHSEESISLTAPSTVGTYYYGACVDAVADESDTTDNCSGSVKVDVGAPARRVDISQRSLTLEALGDSKTVTLRILEENGDEDPDASFFWIGISPTEEKWCCDFEVVDGGLKVTANKPGHMLLSIHSAGSDAKPATLSVTARQKPVSLEVSPDSASLEVGETVVLSVTVKNANGNAIDINSVGPLDDG